MSRQSKIKRDQKKKKQKKTQKSTGVSIRKMKRISVTYPDVLQNIEKTIVLEYQSANPITDVTAANALRYFIYNKETQDPQTISLVDKLTEVKSRRSDISNTVWLECARVVLDSIKTHSFLEPNSTSYLKFVEGFL